MTFRARLSRSGCQIVTRGRWISSQGIWKARRFLEVVGESTGWGKPSPVSAGRPSVGWVGWGTAPMRPSLPDLGEHERAALRPTVPRAGGQLRLHHWTGHLQTWSLPAVWAHYARHRPITSVNSTPPTQRIQLHTWKKKRKRKKIGVFRHCLTADE